MAEDQGTNAAAPAGQTAPPEPQVVDESHRYTTVLCEPIVGAGNAHHVYQIRRKEDGKVLGDIRFQEGPIKEAGVNGVMDENLLAIVIDRLRGFQAGKYATGYNKVALDHLEDALQTLKNRTADRIRRNVEGTHQV